MKAVLHRLADTPFGVFGYLDLLEDDGRRVLRLCTAEDDWRDNQPRVSCIPVGTYLCRRGVFPRMGETFEITGVPGRSAILFHAGNTEEDVEGCVLLGRQFGAIAVPDEDDPTHPSVIKWAVVQSRAAMQDFRSALAGGFTFPLEVRWAPPGSWR